MAATRRENLQITSSSHGVMTMVVLYKDERMRALKHTTMVRHDIYVCIVIIIITIHITMTTISLSVLTTILYHHHHHLHQYILFTTILYHRHHHHQYISLLLSQCAILGVKTSSLGAILGVKTSSLFVLFYLKLKVGITW